MTLSKVVRKGSYQGVAQWGISTSSEITPSKATAQKWAALENARAPLGRSKAARSRKVEISFHSDNATGSNAHPAINVKIQRAPYVDAPEHITAAAWDEAVESFWECAGTFAVEHGYSGVFSEGRSDGWLVPYTQHDSTGKLVTRWTGQGPDKGYPVYPDVENKAERRRFIKFRESIEKLLRESLAYYVELASELAAEPGPAAGEGKAV